MGCPVNPRRLLTGVGCVATGWQPTLLRNATDVPTRTTGAYVGALFPPSIRGWMAPISSSGLEMFLGNYNNRNPQISDANPNLVGSASLECQTALAVLLLVEYAKV